MEIRRFTFLNTYFQFKYLEFFVWINCYQYFSMLCLQ